MSKHPAPKSAAPKIAKTPSAARAQSPNTDERAFPCGFSSLPGFAAFALLAVLLFLSPYLFSGFWPVSYEYWPQSLFLSLTACACLAWSLAPESKTQNSKSKTALFLTIFIAWCAISFGSTVYLHDSLLEFSRLIGVVACFFLARTFLAPKATFSLRVQWLLASTLAGGVLICVPAILDFFATRNPRQFATFYNPNLFANYCAMLLPLAASGVLLLWQKSRRGKGAQAKTVLTIGFVVLAIIALGLIVTSSKGGFLAALCGTLVFIIAVFRAKGERAKKVLQANKAAFAIAGILVLLVVGFLFSQTILPRLSSNIQNDHSTMFRVYTWAGTWRMASARPVSGWGAGSFPSAYTQFAETGYTRSAHQSWLQIAAESGFPAMLLLLAACVIAFASGWKALRGPAWPVATGSLGALVAFVVHGLTDSGWGIISIGALLMAVLALLETASAQADAEPATATASSGQINWLWLLATLPLALGSWISQRAQTGEDLRTESRQLMARGAQSSALEAAKAATDADSLSARLWTNLAQTQQAASQDAWSAYEKATQLQPTRGLNWLNIAKYSFGLDKPAEETLSLFDKAIKFDPNDTEIRWGRAGFGDKATGLVYGIAWKDIEYIAALKDKPYGKYPATPEMVDLNFARAYSFLAARAVKKNPSEAKKLIKRGFDVIKEGREWEPQRRKMEEATQGRIDESREQDMNYLETQLKGIQEQLK